MTAPGDAAPGIQFAPGRLLHPQGPTTNPEAMPPKTESDRAPIDKVTSRQEHFGEAMLSVFGSMPG